MIYPSSKQITAPTETLTPARGRQAQSLDEAAVATLPPTILVVDDDCGVSDLLQAALNAWGYDVVSASNGQEGLQVLAKQTVDGVLLDIHMPIMGGRTMLDEIRWLGYQVPVVVMSGGMDVSTLQQLVKEGAQGYTVKPFSLPSLEKLCATIFENSSVESHPNVPLSMT